MAEQEIRRSSLMSMARVLVINGKFGIKKINKTENEVLNGMKQALELNFE